MIASNRWCIALGCLCASGCVLPRIDRWEPDGAADDRVVVSDALADGAIDATDVSNADVVIVDAGDGGAPLDVVDATADTGVDTGACSVGQTRCGAACVSTQSDPNNCGSCGSVCLMSAPTCSGGMCRSACGVGETNCSGACVNLQTSVTHCGACGARCVAPAGGSTSCVGGSCRPMCPPGLTLDAMTMRCVSECGATTACTSPTDCPPSACGTALFTLPWTSLMPCSLTGYGMASAASIRDCTTAARAACSARGYARGGWGPIGGDAVSGTIVCESATYAAAPTTSTAVTVSADGPRLCGPTSQWGNNCTAAIVDSCVGRGGFGAIELAGTMAMGVCYPNSRATMITVSSMALPSACTAGMIPDLSRRSNGCLNGLATLCRGMVPGSIAGTGPVRDEAAPSLSFVWCVRPTV